MRSEEFDVFDDQDSWILPALDSYDVIPRNFKLARELHRTLGKSLDLEFMFYNFVSDEIVVVDPIDSLHLFIITIESECGTHYVSTAIDAEMWALIKPQMIYVGLV